MPARVKLVVSIDGRKGPVDRLLEWLREGGYTVKAAGAIGRKCVAEVETPYGEVDARPHFVGRRAAIRAAVEGARQLEAAREKHRAETRDAVKTFRTGRRR
jgi:hypothetical protein